MITQLEFDNLQPGNILENEDSTLEVCGKFHKILLVINESEEAAIYSLSELKDYNFSISKPIKLNQGFEVREYPERPVVLVGNNGFLRFLAEVKENKIICVSEANPRYSTSAFSEWEVIKKVN